MNRVWHLSPPYALVRGRHGLFLVNRNDAYIGRSFLEYGEYGLAEWRLLAQLFGPNDNVVEVGANLGAFTVPIATRTGIGGQVIAIEPQPVVHQNLCANLALNSLFNVRTLQVGCAAKSGKLALPRLDYSRPGNFGGVALQASGDVVVDVVTLDSIVDVRHLALLKIDVEGMEESVLGGAAELIREFSPILYLENDRVELSRSLIEAVWSLGYRAWWHVPGLYHGDNYFQNRDNVFGDVASFNMLCIPAGSDKQVKDLSEVTDSAFHPLARGR